MLTDSEPQIFTSEIPEARSSKTTLEPVHLPYIEKSQRRGEVAMDIRVAVVQMRQEAHTDLLHQTPEANTATRS